MIFKILLLAMFTCNVFSLKCGKEAEMINIPYKTETCAAGDKYCVTIKVGKDFGKGCFLTVASIAKDAVLKGGDVQEFIDKYNICAQEGCADHVINKDKVEICCCKGDMCNDSKIAPVSSGISSLASQKTIDATWTGLLMRVATFGAAGLLLLNY